MSNSELNWAFEQSLKPASAKFVLVALASVFPFSKWTLLIFQYCLEPGHSQPDAAAPIVIWTAHALIYRPGTALCCRIT